jgi:hypothetical protein
MNKITQKILKYHYKLLMRTSFAIVIIWFFLLLISILRKYMNQTTDYFNIFLFGTVFLFFLDRWLCSTIIKEKERKIRELKNEKRKFN